MRSLVILMGVVVALVNSQNATETNSDAPASNSSTRLPRGTVYQIRPVNFDDTSDSNPFTALDSIAGIDLAKLKSRAIDDKPSQQDSSYPSPSSSSVRVINLKDSDAVEAVDIPKFLLSASSGPVGRREFSNDDQEEEGADLGKREPKSSPSQPVPIHSEDGAEEPWDASYAFGYTLEDQARHEVSDPDGNIRGYYQYVDDEGYVRKVVYTAGAGKGFVVLNKEKVKGPRPYPPKKTNHHHHSKPGNAPPGYDPRPSSSRPPGPRPNRPRPNYPQSSDPDFDFPESPKAPPQGPSSSPPRPGWSSPSPPSPPSPPRLGWTSGKEGGSRRPIYVVKIRKPQHKHGEEEDDGPPGGYFTNKGGDSSEDSGQWDGDVGYGPVYKYRGGKKGHVSGQPRPDGSYTFGYETETANRLEKSDNFGNVRGSYSYIDNEGVKRTVHYIAGATTGFQVLGSSPSSSRSVRIEAPPGFVVTRRNAPPSSASTVAPSLSTAESEYPGFPPNVIVYHIQADANSLNLSPWWDAFGYSKRPRKMRRIMRVHRKKPRNFRKNEEDEEDEQQQGLDKETQIQQGPISDIKFEDDNGSTSSTPQTPTRERALPPTDNLDNAVPLSDELSPSSVDTSSPRPMYLIRTRSDNDRPRPFRHSTKVNLDNNFDMKTFFVRARRPSHRAYTKNFFGPESDPSSGSSSGEERDHNDPILLGPSHSSLRARRRLPVPNPILLKPSSSRVSVRSRGARLDVAESNAYPVVSTPPSGDEVQVPPTPNPVELFAAGNLETGDASSREVSTSKSMQLSISSSTTRIPVSSETPSPVTPPPTPPSSTSSEPPTTPAPASTPSPRENTLTLTDKEFEHTGIGGGIMSSSTRLMQRLGVQQPNLGGTAAPPDNQN